MSKAALANDHRPERFEDVWGQQVVVRCLSGLIIRGQIERNLLLHGSVGSGKTTLARIYARALNCASPTRAGSPCGACAACTSADQRGSGLYEHDCAGRGGDLKTIEAFVRPLDSPGFECRVRVLFFDEAHRLEDDAADFLLKRVEEKRPGFVYCFATTEYKGIRKALRSRLMQFEVRPLEVAESISFLEEIARRERIECERQALALLAGLKQGHPRDLLFGLEQVYEPGRRLEARHVREMFGVDQAEFVAEYFKALARGDLVSQLHLISKWPEPASEKARWLRAFVASMYFNDILFVPVVVDCLVDDIQAPRQKILSTFCGRLGVSRASGLVSFWRGLLDFWANLPLDMDDAELFLHVARFHLLVCDECRSAHSKESAQNAVLIGPQVAPLASDSDSAVPAAHQGRFFGREDARQIINCASFFMQEYGQLFNVRFEVSPNFFGATSESEARREIELFLNELQDISETKSVEGAPFAAVCLVERLDDGFLRGVVLAHAPWLGKASQNTAAREGLERWAECWGEDRRKMLGGVEISFPPSPRSDLNWHWENVVDLCAGLDAGAEGALLRDLGVARSQQRSTGPIEGPRVLVSNRLQEWQIELASAPRMRPLSAFDDRAWDQLRTGWEFQEHQERKATKEARRRRLAEIQAIFAYDETTRAAHVRELIASWSNDPHERSRRWPVWWRTDLDF